MTILEYYYKRLRDEPIVPRKHPMFYKRKSYKKDWKYQEAIKWFDLKFPMTNLGTILEIFPEPSEELIERINSWGLHRVTIKSPHGETNSFIYNETWGARPDVKVSCRCCGVTNETTIQLKQLFPKAPLTKLGVETICISCKYETEVREETIDIAGPYCRLKDSHKCISCGTVGYLETIPVLFNIARKPLEPLGKGFISSYKKICKSCERALKLKKDASRLERETVGIMTVAPTETLKES